MAYNYQASPRRATRRMGQMHEGEFAALSVGGKYADVETGGGFGDGWPVTRRRGLGGESEGQFAALSVGGFQPYTEGQTGFGRVRRLRRFGATTSDTALETAANAIVPGAGNIIQTVVTLLGGEPPADMTTARVQALQACLTAASQGNLNGAQQLYNWAYNTGSTYPRGGEPQPTIPVALKAWQQFAAACPVWAAYIDGPGGENGDSVDDAGGPQLYSLTGVNYGATAVRSTATASGFLSQSVAGIPLWVILLGGGVGVYLATRK